MRRREFMSSTAVGVSVLAASARSYAQVTRSNNRVRVGLIGCGTRGMHVAGLMRAAPDTQFVAVADVYARNRERAKSWAGADADAYGDFRHMLDRPDIDAVLVATPDHWHAIPTVLACRAGKDVYVEKPLAHNIREGRAMVDAAREHERIVQIGTQHRSAPHYAEVQKMVQGGQIGNVRFVRVWNYTNRTRGGFGGQRSDAMPEGLDWDFYLGPAPQVPFERGRFLGSFRGYFDYAGGYVTDWGTHRFDSVRQVMGEPNPLTVTASGARYEVDDSSDTPDVVQATVQFAEFTMSYEAIQTSAHGVGGRTPDMRYYRMAGSDDRPHGAALYGTEGAIIMDRIGFDVYPERTRRGRAAAATESGDRLERRSVASRDTTDLHAANFIASVRSRRRSVADVEVGHLSTIVPHLMNIAYRSGRKLHWDAQTETITEDPVSSALLTRKARAPWDIVAGT